MKRTTAPGHASNQYVDQDNATNVAGTQLVAEDRNIIQEELANILIRLGKTLDGTRSDQIGTLLNSILFQIVSLSSMDTNNRIPTVSRLTNPIAVPGNDADKSNAFLNLSPVTINASGDINNARNVIASGNISANGHITASGQLRSNNVTNLTGSGAPNFPEYFTAALGEWSGYNTISTTERFTTLTIPSVGYFYQIQYMSAERENHVWYVTGVGLNGYDDAIGSSDIRFVGFSSIPNMGLVPAGSTLEGVTSNQTPIRYRRVL